MRHAIHLKILALVIFCALPGGAGAFAAEGSGEDADPEVLATVNGEDITGAELKRYAEYLYASRRRGVVTRAEKERAQRQTRRAALKQLVERRLLVQAAREEIFGDRNADKVLTQMGERQLKEFERDVGSPIRVRKVLQSRRITRKEFKKMAQERALIGEYLRQKVEQEIFVPPWKTRQYYRQNREQYHRPRTVVFRQLWVNAGGDEGRDKAERILQKIRSGASFAELADKHGSASDRHPGGLHRVEGRLRGWLEELLKNLEPGEVSDVVERPIGYCIVKLEKWQEAGTQSFEEVADGIRRKLRQQTRQEKRRSLLKKLRREATIEFTSAARPLLDRGSPGEK